LLIETNSKAIIDQQLKSGPQKLDNYAIVIINAEEVWKAEKPVAAELHNFPDQNNVKGIFQSMKAVWCLNRCSHNQLLAFDNSTMH